MVASLLVTLAATLVVLPTAPSAATPPAASTPAPATATVEITPPELLEFVAAPLTGAQSALAAPVAVTLAITITATGAVEEATVTASAGEPFDTLARDAAMQFRFAPARRGDQAIPVQIQFRYTFEPPPPPTATLVEPDEPVDPEPPKPTAPPDDELGAVDESDVVRAPAMQRRVLSTTIEPQQGERVAGTQGDTLKVVQTLGGVARAPVGTSDLIVWGAAPSDTRLYIDHMPVPRLFHLGGARSVLPSASVGAVHLVPGGYAAEYGRGIGGLVRVDTTDLPATLADRKVGGYARVDPIDVGVGAQTRVGPRTFVSVGGRKSLLNESLDLVVPNRSRDLVPIADYWDLNGKVDHRLSGRESLQLTVVSAHDQVRRGIPSVTPDLSFHEQTRDAFHRVGLRFERARDDRSTARIDAWAGLDEHAVTQDFVTVSARGSERALRGGLRLSQRQWVHSHLRLDGGVDLELARTHNTRRGAMSLPAREGDITVFGQPPGDRIGSDRWRTTNVQAGLYLGALADLAHGRVTLEPGVRFEPMIISGDRVLPVRETEPAVGYTTIDAAIDPRLRVSWQPVEALTLHVAGGRYHQSPVAADMSPVFGTPMLDPASAWHAIVGTTVRPWSWLDVAVTGFWVEQADRTVRSPLATPPTAELLVSEGRGRNYGGQAQIRFRPAESLFAWLSYAWIDATRQDHGDRTWRPFDRDQRHSAQAMASWLHATGFEIGARAEVASGYPRTPVVDAVYNAHLGAYDPIFGEHNADRLPWFVQLSARVGWRKEWDELALKTWIDVQNVTNHRNVEELFYNFDYSQKHGIEGLPILPLVGVEVRR